MQYSTHRPIVIMTLTAVIGLSIAFALPWLANTHSKAAQMGFNPDNESAPEVAKKYHVAKTGSGTDGLDWTNAFTNVQDALAFAVALDEIWVAKGVYYPDVGSGQVDNERTSTFVMADGVALIGGFNFGDTDISDQDPMNKITVLSGDIDWDNGGADITDPNGVVLTTINIAGDNAYHVVTGSGVTNTAVLDGFTITAGQADGDYPEERGGGMYNNSSSPVLTNVTFSGNSAGSTGGGMENFESSPALTNVSFSGNSADFGGGGMFNAYSSSPALTNVSFSGNSAGDSGGGMFNAYGSSPMLTNVTFSGNSAGSHGGGIYNYASSLDVRNSILWNNRDASGNGTISATVFLLSPVVSFTNSLIQATGGSSGWIVKPGLFNGGGNIDEDPIFVPPINPSSAPTTTGDLRLKIDSPAIDIGNNIYVPFGITTDLAGDERIVDGNITGVATVDMGAYEYQTHYQLTVTKAGTGSGRVISSPSGIDCGYGCSSSFTNGSDSTLSAAADPGSKFTGWSGDCTGSETCLVKMDRSRKVFANFELILQQIFQPVIFR